MMAEMGERREHVGPWMIVVRDVSPTARQKPRGVGEVQWRNAMRDRILDAYPDAPFGAPEAPIRYSVEIVFRMTAPELTKRTVDLDNLAKPVLDTVFTSANVSSKLPTGCLLSVNDTWVFDLHLRKVQVDSPEERGADISVYPGATG